MDNIQLGLLDKMVANKGMYTILLVLKNNIKKAEQLNPEPVEVVCYLKYDQTSQFVTISIRNHHYEASSQHSRQC